MKCSFFSVLLVMLAVFVGCKTSDSSTALTPTQRTVRKRAEFRRQLAADPDRTIMENIDNEDPVIRARCAYELYARHGIFKVKMVFDTSEQVAEVLLACGIDMQKTHHDDTLLETGGILPQ